MSVRESMLETQMWDLADHHGVLYFSQYKKTRVHSTRSSPEMNRKRGGISKKVGSLKEVCLCPKGISEEYSCKIKYSKENCS